jgi:N-acetylmuramoyl-L-alanine amidase
MNQSKNLANTVVAGFRTGDVPTLKGPHRYAGFAVLKAPDVPSILIETGFVSNDAEAKRLLTPAYQTRIAKALLKSLDRHFGY